MCILHRIALGGSLPSPLSSLSSFSHWTRASARVADVTSTLSATEDVSLKSAGAALVESSEVGSTRLLKGSSSAREGGRAVPATHDSLSGFFRLLMAGAHHVLTLIPAIFVITIPSPFSLLVRKKEEAASRNEGKQSQSWGRCFQKEWSSATPLVAEVPPACLSHTAMPLTRSSPRTRERRKLTSYPRRWRCIGWAWRTTTHMAPPDRKTYPSPQSW